MTNTVFKKGVDDAYKSILTDESIKFVEELHRRFDGQRILLLKKRIERQKDIDTGNLPDFLKETASIRNSQWQVNPVGEDIQDRRVEITGPVDRKMMINALNSGAKVFMADFEDSNAPTWKNNMDGQVNAYDAIRGTIEFTNPKNGKEYKLNNDIATLFIRPRGLHLEDKFVEINGRNASGSLLDFGFYFFHNAKQLIKNGSGPYFYIPKLESHKEARLWNDIFVFAQEYIGIPQGTIKATVLIETILAAFETEEILYELKEHSAGLNCGRWDYIFSYIKKFSKNSKFVLPDRSQVTMNVHFMKSYAENTIKTCHKRGAFAMGGMAAQIPIKNDSEANEKALAKVAEDKKREAMAGHDGTWVAHPGLIPIAMKEFDTYMPNKNQLSKQRDDVNVTAADLLAVPKGTITLEGFKNNIDVSIQYIYSWLNGLGCVPIYNLMEDAATAEISRAQLWQWVRNNAKLDDGTVIDKKMFNNQLELVIKSLKNRFDTEASNFKKTIGILKELVLNDTFEEFLTLKTYETFK